MVDFCIGSAQFGMDYGVTNPLGKVPENEIKKIIEYASKNKIKFFDTAQTYGNSEKILGNYLKNFNKPKVISKLSVKRKDLYDENDIKSWEDSFIKSLKNLNLEKIDSFLIHDANTLKKEGADILKNWLGSLVSRGLVDRVGISIYDAQDLEGISLEDIKLIQLPLSLYDQRMIKNGTIDMLIKKEIAIHARSIFFQGLLLVNQDFWPNSISKRFREHHKKNLGPLNKLNSLEIILDFIFNCQFLEAALIGVTSLNQIKEIVNVRKNLEEKGFKEFEKYQWDNNFDLDPRNWNL